MSEDVIFKIITFAFVETTKFPGAFPFIRIVDIVARKRSFFTNGININFEESPKNIRIMHYLDNKFLLWYYPFINVFCALPKWVKAVICIAHFVLIVFLSVVSLCRKAVMVLAFCF